MTVFVAVVIGAVLLAIALPLRVVPALGLVAFATYPAAYIATMPGALATRLTPAVAVVAIWCIRAALLPKGARRVIPRTLVSVVTLLGLTCLIVAILGPTRSQSVTWVLTAMICTTLVFAAANPSVCTPAVEPLLRTWRVLAVAISVMLVAEYFTNYSVLGQFFNFDQHWSAFRATATLGHPIAAGGFLAVSAALLASDLRRHPRRGAAMLVVIVAGAFATGSRSALLALIGGFAVFAVVTFTSRSQRRSLGPLFATLLGFALIASIAWPNVIARATSDEGSSSYEYRFALLDLVRALPLQNVLLGGGAGTSDSIFARYSKLPLENAWLGHYVSMGFVGVVWISLAFAVVLVVGWRHRQPDVLGATAALAIAGGASPAWEYNVASLVLLALLAIAAVGRSDVSGSRGEVGTNANAAKRRSARAGMTPRSSSHRRTAPSAGF